jgi:hypothetical protein
MGQLVIKTAKLLILFLVQRQDKRFCLPQGDAGLYIGVNRAGFKIMS